MVFAHRASFFSRHLAFGDWPYRVQSTPPRAGARKLYRRRLGLLSCGQAVASGVTLGGRGRTVDAAHSVVCSRGMAPLTRSPVPSQDAVWAPWLCCGSRVYRAGASFSRRPRICRLVAGFSRRRHGALGALRPFVSGKFQPVSRPG